MVRTKSLPHFFLHSLSLVGIQDIRSSIVSFLEFEQPYIEQFDPTIFKTKKLQLQTIPAKIICLYSTLSGEKWVLVLHGSQHHENSQSLREFPDYSYVSGKKRTSWIRSNSWRHVEAVRKRNKVYQNRVKQKEPWILQHKLLLKKFEVWCFRNECLKLIHSSIPYQQVA